MRITNALALLAFGVAAAGAGYLAGGPASHAAPPARADTTPPGGAPAGAAAPGDEAVPEKFDIRDNTRLLKRMLRGRAMQQWLQLWGSNSEGLFRNQWLGVDTIQNPFDVWITQEILYERKPDFVVETGTFRGGSALVWATLLEQINPDARIISVDIQNDSAEVRERPLAKEKVEFLVGSSTDPAIVERIAKRVAGGRVVVILDSDHRQHHVYNELKAYAPLVEVGSYIIVQDTGMAVPSPRAMGWANLGVARFLDEDDRFAVDRSRERLVLTNNPGGFLERVR